MGIYHFHILISLPSNSSLSTRFLHINACFSYCFILPSTTFSFIFHLTVSFVLPPSTFHHLRHYSLHFPLLHPRSFHFLFPPPSLPLSLFSLSSYFIHLSAITFVPHTFSSLTVVPSTFPRVPLPYLFISSTFLSPCPYSIYIPPHSHLLIFLLSINTHLPIYLYVSILPILNSFALPPLLPQAPPPPPQFTPHSPPKMGVLNIGSSSLEGGGG